MEGDLDVVREWLSLDSLSGGEPRGGEYTGTKALMIAVLEDGIRSCCEHLGARRTEAENWVRSNRRPPFSFVVICETLGLDPDAVRQAVARMQTQDLPQRLRAKAQRDRRKVGK